MFVYFYPTFVFLLFLIFAEKVNREMKLKVKRMFKNVPFEWILYILILHYSSFLKQSLLYVIDDRIN